MQDLLLYPQPSTVNLRQPLLSMDVTESAEERIERVITENPVVIFSRHACCMCHVIKRLFLAVGAHPAVIELDEAESVAGKFTGVVLPAVFVGGEFVGGVERVMELHVGEKLVPRLVEVGAVWGADL